MRISAEAPASGSRQTVASGKWIKLQHSGNHPFKIKAIPVCVYFENIDK